jgi:hypothetical protein
MHARVCVCVCVCACMWMCMCVLCVYVDVYVCVYVYVYVHVHVYGYVCSVCVLLYHCVDGIIIYVSKAKKNTMQKPYNITSLKHHIT